MLTAVLTPKDIYRTSVCCMRSRYLQHIGKCLSPVESVNGTPHCEVNLPSSMLTSVDLVNAATAKIPSGREALK